MSTVSRRLLGMANPSNAVFGGKTEKISCRLTPEAHDAFLLKRCALARLLKRETVSDGDTLEFILRGVQATKTYLKEINGR